jgi:hypothetical protein
MRGISDKHLTVNFRSVGFTVANDTLFNHLIADKPTTATDFQLYGVSADGGNPQKF